MRYAISGATVFDVGTACDSLGGASSGCVNLVHGTATGTLSARGRVFWLRGLWATSVASSFTLGLADASYGATGANVTPLKKFALAVASYAPSTGSDLGWDPSTRFVPFPAPGLKFTTNCLAFLITGSGATGGTIGGCGYEE